MAKFDPTVFTEQIEKCFTILQQQKVIIDTIINIMEGSIDISELENLQTQVDDINNSIEELNTTIRQGFSGVNNSISDLFNSIDSINDEIYPVINTVENTINYDEENDTTIIKTPKLDVGELVLESQDESETSMFIKTTDTEALNYRVSFTNDNMIYLYTSDLVERMNMSFDREVPLSYITIKGNGDDNIRISTEEMLLQLKANNYDGYEFITDIQPNKLTLTFNSPDTGERYDWTLSVTDEGLLFEHYDNGEYVSETQLQSGGISTDRIYATNIVSNQFTFGSFGDLTYPTLQNVKFDKTGTYGQQISRSLLNNLLYVGQFFDSNHDVYRLSFEDGDQASVKFNNIKFNGSNIIYSEYEIDTDTLDIGYSEWTIH